MNVRALVAELVGTMLFVFIGVMSVIAGFYPEGGAANLATIALGHGIGMAAIITLFAPISGAHLNPAVTFGLFLAGKIKFDKVIPYWIAQIVGAMIGAVIAFQIMGPSIPVDSNGGVPSVGTYMLPWTAALAEAIGAMFLTFVVLGTAVYKGAPKMGGLYIGFAIAAMICAIGPMTGASINPARFLGPGIVANKLANSSPMSSEPYGVVAMLMIYVVGPLIGAFVAALLYKYMFKEVEESTQAA